MKYRLFSVFFFILLHLAGFGQTNRMGMENLSSFEEPCIEISGKVLQLHSSRILDASQSKSVSIKAEIEKQVEKEMSRFSLKNPFNHQENLKAEFIKFLDSVRVSLDFPAGQTQSAHSVFDSTKVVKLQNLCIDKLENLAKAGGCLDREIQNFCLLNRITGRKESPGFYALFYKQAKAMRYAFDIQNVVLEARATERRFFTALMEDTGTNTLATETCKKLCEIACNGTLKLKAIPAMRNDFNLKAAGLNSLRLYQMEATNDLPKLLIFREKEREFMRLNVKMKQSPFAGNEAKEQYRNALKEYLEHIKESNYRLKELAKGSVAHEKPFDDAFRAFIGSRAELAGW